MLDQHPPSALVNLRGDLGTIRTSSGRRAEGWVHNRVRPVIASFLVTDLHLPWQRGTRFFPQRLHDEDLVSHRHGWPWVAGTGTDTAPYMRVLNPVMQGRRFDPDGRARPSPRPGAAGHIRPARRTCPATRGRPLPATPPASSTTRPNASGRSTGSRKPPGAPSRPRPPRGTRHNLEVIVVAVISLKGGVGKTTVTLGLAGAAWSRGLRTLVVDLDPQGNATSALDPSVSPTASTATVLDRPVAGGLAAAAVPSGWGGDTELVPAGAGLERQNGLGPSSGPEATLRLRVAMGGLTGYPLVLLDCPPSLGSLTRNALAAAHRALVVTEPTYFAVRGAAQALQAIESVRAYNLRLAPAGLVVNRVRSHATEHRFRLDELSSSYQDLLYDPPLPDRMAIQQAQGAAVPVQAWHSAGAREVAQIFDDYLDRLLAAQRHGGQLRPATPRADRSRP